MPKLKDSRAKAKHYALRLLHYRPRSRKEMFEKLRRKGFNDDQINGVMEFLGNAGLLEDKILAAELFRNAIRRRYLGRKGIEMFLLNRGIERELINETLLSHTQEMEEEAANTIKKAGAIKDIIYERAIDMRFIGQGFEVNVPIPGVPFSQFSKDDIRSYYDGRYQVLYGRTFDAPLEFVSFRVNARLPERPLQLPKIKNKAVSLKDTVKGKRVAFSPIAKDFIPYTVYDRHSLYPGAVFDGPAIIEEKESTTIVGEDASVSVDDYGFLWVNLKEV